MPLFHIAIDKLVPVEQTNFSAEKVLQALIEGNLDTVFGCRLVASQFSTGAKHAGRIDTLALSEDNNPVIIEYKKVESSELINQSLFYLAWLNDHRGDFEIAVQKALGPKVGVDWSDGDASGAFDPSKIEVKVEPSKAAGEVVAGDPLEIKVTVTNNGTVPLFRLRAQTKSDAGIFDGKEFVFGKIEPGKSRTWTTPMGWCETEGYKAGSSAVLPKDAPRV